MNSLLYYSISSDFSKEEITIIDKKVAKNQEKVYLFVKKLPSNSKRKAKRLFAYAMLLFQLGQPLVPCVYSITLSAPPPIERLASFEQNRILENKNKYPQIAPIIESKIDKIVLTDEQIDNLNLIYYKLQNGSITIDKAILEIRGGGLYDWATLAFMLYLFYLQEQAKAFRATPLPYMDPIGWWTGKYEQRPYSQCPSYPPSRFERETLHTMKQMCKASADENGFVMSYEEAYNLVK